MEANISIEELKRRINQKTNKINAGIRMQEFKSRVTGRSEGNKKKEITEDIIVPEKKPHRCTNILLGNDFVEYYVFNLHDYKLEKLNSKPSVANSRLIMVSDWFARKVDGNLRVEIFWFDKEVMLTSGLILKLAELIKQKSKERKNATIK